MLRVIAFASLALVTTLSATNAQTTKAEKREAVCRSEPTPTERMICNDRNLTRLDGALNDSYQEVRRQLNKADRARLRSEQLRWLRARNACRRDYACVQRAYNRRTDQLDDMVRPISQPAQQFTTCKGEGKYRSQASLEKTKITFRVVGENDETSYKIYWLDFQGRRKLYKHVFANENYTQPTYLSHPWLITAPVPGGGEDCIAIFWPTAKARTIVLD